MDRTSYTLGRLLSELKEDLPSLKVGMFFETTKSIYPSSEVPKDKKNILIENEYYTLPLALSGKEKKEMKNRGTPLISFFRENKRGDFLKIKEKRDKLYICENISLDKEKREKYYKDFIIEISDKDIIDGTVKPIIRIRNSYLLEYMEE